MTIYDFKVKNNKGEEVSLETYKGKVLLVVNTATKCGLTPQYKELEELYDKYKDKGLEILDFPCNQFLEQAPGTDEEISEFCTLNYGTKFPRFSKVLVNGPDTHPLYAWLKEQASVDRGNEETAAFEEKVKGLVSFEEEGAIKWNFGKFLIDKEGHVRNRFSPAYNPSLLEKEIEELL